MFTLHVLRLTLVSDKTTEQILCDRHRGQLWNLRNCTLKAETGRCTKYEAVDRPQASKLEIIIFEVVCMLIMMLVQSRQIMTASDFGLKSPR